MRGEPAVGEAPARCRPRPAPRPLAPRAPALEAVRTAPRAPEPPRERPRPRGRPPRAPPTAAESGATVWPKRLRWLPGALRGARTRPSPPGFCCKENWEPLGWRTVSPGPDDTFCMEPGLGWGPRRPERLLRLALGAGAAPSDPPDKTHFGEMSRRHVVLLLRAALGPAFVEVSDLG